MGVLLIFRDLGKLVTLLRAFPAGEPTKKKFVDEMIAWSINFGDFPHGDPELHHVAGSLFAEGMMLSFSYASCKLISIARIRPV